MSAPFDMDDLVAVLRDARDFIDRYSDMRDSDYGGQEPNEAMQIVHAIDQVLP